MLRSDNTVTTKRLVGGPSTGEPAEETKKVLVHKGGGVRNESSLWAYEMQSRPLRAAVRGQLAWMSAKINNRRASAKRGAFHRGERRRDCSAGRGGSPPKKRRFWGRTPRPQTARRVNDAWSLRAEPYLWAAPKQPTRTPVVSSWSMID